MGYSIDHKKGQIRFKSDQTFSDVCQRTREYELNLR